MSSNHRQVMSRASDEAQKSREREESGPHVGLFYVVDGKLYWEGVSTEQAHTSAFFKMYPKKHSAYWKGSVLRLRPDLKDYDWCQFPRGRVVFSSQEGIYQLMADKCILENSALVKKIVSEMRLSELKIKMSWDIGCECVVCKSDRTRIKDDKDCEIEAEFKTAEDGYKIFFPWKRYFPWVRGRGYIVSLPEYERIRRGESRWLKLGATLATFNAIVISKFTLYSMHSGWMTSLAMVFLGSYIPFALSHILWIRHQCRGLKQTDARGLELSHAGIGKKTGTTWAFGVVLLPLLIVIAVWLMLGIPQDLLGVGKQSQRTVKATASMMYTGEELPYELCNAIHHFTKRVDSAVTQQWGRSAELAVQGAWVEFDNILKEFDDHPNINEIRDKAMAYARTRLEANAMKDTARWFSDQPQWEEKIKERRAALNAMCPH